MTISDQKTEQPTRLGSYDPFAPVDDAALLALVVPGGDLAREGDV